MGQSSLLDILRAHMSNGITRESDVVYLFIEIGKYLEHERGHRYPLLRFYRNWVAHSWIGRLGLAGEIPREVDEAVGDGVATKVEQVVLRVNNAISMKRLESELSDFLTATRVSVRLRSSEREWRMFLRLLVGILADVPLVFRGYRNVRSFVFLDNMMTESGDELSAMWEIEARGCAFRGRIVLS